MAFGKMNTFVNIVTTTPTKDVEGFVKKGDTVLASVRAYKEEKHGTERWANMAAFSEATALFRFQHLGDDFIRLVAKAGEPFFKVGGEF